MTVIIKANGTNCSWDCEMSRQELKSAVVAAVSDLREVSAHVDELDDLLETMLGVADSVDYISRYWRSTREPNIGCLVGTLWMREGRYETDIDADGPARIEGAFGVQILSYLPTTKHGLETIIRIVDEPWELVL